MYSHPGMSNELPLSIAENAAPRTFVAFWEIWNQHRSHLYGVCLKQMNGRAADAQDALSAAMLRAREKLPRYAGQIDDLKAWLTRLTSNLCTDLQRERGRQVRRLESLEALHESGWDYQTEACESPEERMLRYESVARVRRAVEEMPASLREPLLMRFWGDADYGEIAERLSLSAVNTRKRIQQARGVLRERLDVH